MARKRCASGGTGCSRRPCSLLLSGNSRCCSRRKQELQAQRRLVWPHWVVRREPRVVALSARRRGARSGSEVHRKVRFGVWGAGAGGVLAPFGAGGVPGAGRSPAGRSPAGRSPGADCPAGRSPGDRSVPAGRSPGAVRSCPLGCAAGRGGLALPAPEEAAWLQAEPGALPRAAGAAAALPAGLVAAVSCGWRRGLWLFGGRGAVRRPAAPGAAEVRPAGGAPGAAFGGGPFGAPLRRLLFMLLLVTGLTLRLRDLNRRRSAHARLRLPICVAVSAVVASSTRRRFCHDDPSPPGRFSAAKSHSQNRTVMSRSTACMGPHCGARKREMFFILLAQGVGRRNLFIAHSEATLVRETLRSEPALDGIRTGPVHFDPVFLFDAFSSGEPASNFGSGPGRFSSKTL